MTINSDLPLLDMYNAYDKKVEYILEQLLKLREIAKDMGDYDKMSMIDYDLDHLKRLYL